MVSRQENGTLKVLVTGGSGLLGAELVSLLSESKDDVLSGYNIHVPSVGNPIRFSLMELDEIQTMLQRVRPDVIIHTAAMTDIDLCEEEPEIANRVNGEATGRICETASEISAYVIYVSTDYVFDGQTGSYREGDKPNPINQYGRSKLLGERLVKESASKSCIARTSVVYGWSREERPNFATWILHRLRSDEHVKVVNDQVASPTLNLNLAEMIIELATKQYEGFLHLAGATRIDRYTFAKQVAEAFNLDPNLIEPVKSDQIGWKAKRPADSSLNVDAAKETLDSKPLELNEALKQFRTAKM
jgi:dTDP-4-dehydrorhamnose reductase